MQPTHPDLPPTFELSERVTTACRLSPADVDFLLDRHRAHVTLLPTRDAGIYCVTPRGHVGILVAPGCRLVIRPKIPVQNLYHLLDATAPPPATEDRAAVNAGGDLLDFLAAHLARLMTERSAAGLHRAYVEQVAQGPFLQGRLDVPQQMRSGHAAKDKVHCRYEEFTADVPCNQLPVATAELVLRSPLLGDAVRPALAAAVRGFGGLRPIALGPEAFAAAPADRLTAAYRPLLELCQLLAESLSPSGAAGELACPAFLLDMERVFESYCTRGLSADFAARPGTYEVQEQPLHHAGGTSNLMMRPDWTLHRGGRPFVVLDAKWKRSPLVRADVYQVLAYCATLGFPRGVLVYPGRRDRSRQHTFAETGLSLDVRTLCVVSDRAACQRSMRRLARSVRRLARPSAQ
jgi:5-methylcytosine-specific restriction enzyme subunit McrC